MVFFSFGDGCFLAGSDDWSEHSFQCWCREGGDGFWKEGSRNVCGSSSCNIGILQKYIRSRLYLDTEVRNTCSDIGGHYSVSHMCHHYVLSETSPVERGCLVQRGSGVECLYVQTSTELSSMLQ